MGLHAQACRGLVYKARTFSDRERELQVSNQSVNISINLGASHKILSLTPLP
jgi:hypothetical protein